jgi:hypothetical protein
MCLDEDPLLAGINTTAAMLETSSPAAAVSHRSHGLLRPICHEYGVNTDEKRMIIRTKKTA